MQKPKFEYEVPKVIDQLIQQQTSSLYEDVEQTALFCKFRAHPNPKNLIHARLQGLPCPKWDVPYHWIKSIQQDTMTEIVEEFKRRVAKLQQDCDTLWDADNAIFMNKEWQNGLLQWLHDRVKIEAVMLLLSRSHLVDQQALNEVVRQMDDACRSKIQALPHVECVEEDPLLKVANYIEIDAWWANLYTPLDPQVDAAFTEAANLYHNK